jgi:hypothetical protein
VDFSLTQTTGELVRGGGEKIQFLDLPEVIIYAPANLRKYKYWPQRGKSKPHTK